MKLEYQNRYGIPETKIIPPLYENVRLTIPAREALEAANAEVAPDGPQTYSVRLSPNDRVPDLVAAIVSDDVRGYVALRLPDEPEYPGEEPTYWQQLDFSPCPKCGKPLVWYEAGYVPGYRVCTGKAHHHVLAR